jgi:hypothetical protein
MNDPGPLTLDALGLVVGHEWALRVNDYRQVLDVASSGTLPDLIRGVLEPVLTKHLEPAAVEAEFWPAFVDGVRIALSSAALTN